jgi:transposase
LHDEIADLVITIARLIDKLALALIARNSIGCKSAAQLSCRWPETNSGRLQSEASFAVLCGVSPVRATSGKVTRYRHGTRHRTRREAAADLCKYIGDL